MTTTFSPPTSTSSYTLSAANSFAPMEHSPLSEVLLSALTSSQHTLLQPERSLHTSALALAKQYLDPLAIDVTQQQVDRQNEQRKKRKRGQSGYGNNDMLRMKKVHVDGFAVDQVWEQARRVLDATRDEIIRALPDVEEETSDLSGGEDSSSPKPSGAKSVRFEEEDESGSEVDSLDEEEDDENEDGLELGSDGEPLDDFDEAEEEYEPEGTDEENGQMGSSDEEDYDDGPVDEYVEDPHGLNDGFFSIDEFNKQSQLLEQQNPQDEDDDEEEIDYFSNPLEAGGNLSLTNGGSRGQDSEDEEDDEEGGPTFGDMDLDAPEGASDEEDDANEDDDEDIEAGDVMGLGNTNNILYADFFAPPAKKASKNKKKRGRPNPHNFPAKDPSTNGTTSAAPEDGDIERTMEAVHRDLFSESEAEDSEDSAAQLDPGDPKSRRSTHERRQAKLAEEIRKLEAANVAKRAWTLSGEARAADRPMNSLLEEDLDFERAGKPVPVITAEISEDIEALIKRRILAGEFDELIKRRPDDLATGASQRRGMLDLPDTKATKGLGEIYDEEHLARTDPNYVSATDAKTQAAHAEITALWADVSRSLDSLSSWHYRPKPAAPSLEVRVDAPALSLEDARPTVGGDMGTESQLAPQEVYKPGSAKTAGQVSTKSGMPVSKEEMDRDDKVRRRRREKERQRKANSNSTIAIGRDGKAVVSGKGKDDRKEMVGALKKGGVKVIGKKGELTNVDGSDIKGGDRRVSGAAFRL